MVRVVRFEFVAADMAETEVGCVAGHLDGPGPYSPGVAKTASCVPAASRPAVLGASVAAWAEDKRDDIEGLGPQRAAGWVVA